MGTANTRNSVMLAATESYLEKIQTFANDMQIDFTDYQKMCVVNAVRTINPMLESNGYTWQNFGIDNILTVLQQTAFFNLNSSAVPRECYFIVRKNYKTENGKRREIAPTIEFGIEGAGNDRILKEFGLDVQEIKSYIVYEGDSFEEGFMDGWEMTLPKYHRLFKSNKPMKVVYLIKKKNGEIDVQYSDVEDVKKSLLANARQNGADEKLIRELNKLGLYEILEDEKWIDYKIKKTYGSNTYTTPLFNPSYTSPISMYNMIERKLRNHATRKYPKNFNNKAISELYEESFEEKYNEKGEPISADEKIAIAQDEIKQDEVIEPTFETTPIDDRETIEPETIETELEESEYSTEEEQYDELEKETLKDMEDEEEEQPQTDETQEEEKSDGDNWWE